MSDERPIPRRWTLVRHSTYDYMPAPSQIAQDESVQVIESDAVADLLERIRASDLTRDYGSDPEIRRDLNTLLAQMRAR